MTATSLSLSANQAVNSLVHAWNIFGVLEVTCALCDVIYYTAFTLCTEGAPHGSVAAALVTTNLRAVRRATIGLERFVPAAHIVFHMLSTVVYLCKFDLRPYLEVKGHEARAPQSARGEGSLYWLQPT